MLVVAFYTDIPVIAHVKYPMQRPPLDKTGSNERQCYMKTQSRRVKVRSPANGRYDRHS